MVTGHSATLARGGAVLSVGVTASGLVVTGVLWVAAQATGNGGGNDHLFGVAAVITAAGTFVVGIVTAGVSLLNALRKPR